MIEALKLVDQTLQPPQPLITTEMPNSFNQV